MFSLLVMAYLITVFKPSKGKGLLDTGMKTHPYNNLDTRA